MAEKTDLNETEKLLFYSHMDKITKAQKAYVLCDSWEKSFYWSAYLTTLEQMTNWINLTIADKVYQAKGEMIKEFIRENNL